MEVLIRPRESSGDAFTFPATDLHLTPEVIEQYKLAPALKRIGLALTHEMRKRRSDGHRVIGVKFHDLAFTMVLDGR